MAKEKVKGLNIYYYGKGKGKTTSVMGLAARAAGSGMNVFILQFVKAKRNRKLTSGEWPLSFEIVFFEDAAKKKSKNIGKIVTEQLGRGFVGILGDKKNRKIHVDAAKEGLKLARKIIDSKKYDLVILDELVSALELGLVKESDIVKLISKKPKHVHLAYTGHDHFDKIAKASDLISEINMVKHPYYKGILAQKGIDY